MFEPLPDSNDAVSVRAATLDTLIEVEFTLLFDDTLITIPSHHSCCHTRANATTRSKTSSCSCSRALPRRWRCSTCCAADSTRIRTTRRPLMWLSTPLCAHVCCRCVSLSIQTKNIFLICFYYYHSLFLVGFK